MNTDIPIFKINKIQHFVPICENTRFEISIFHELNHFITIAYDKRNREMQKSTLLLHYSGHLGSKR